MALLIVLLFGLFTPSTVGQSRVAPDAREIRSYRLTLDHVKSIATVGRALDQAPDRGPESPRSDVTLFTVLAMSLPYNRPYRDADVVDAVKTIETALPDLAAAIRRAGVSNRDYVLAQITLLLSYPVAAQQRAGRGGAVPDDVSAENVAFVERHWTEVDRLITDINMRVGAAARREGR